MVSTGAIAGLIFYISAATGATWHPPLSFRNPELTPANYYLPQLQLKFDNLRKVLNGQCHNGGVQENELWEFFASP
jgi:hypothetical protein